MSIHLPDYSLPPPTLLPRDRRVRAIVWAEIRARMRAINVVVLVLINVVVILPVVLAFYLGALTRDLGGFLSSAAPITEFYTPYALGVWSFLIVLLASSVGAAIIAGDVASRSITMYLARPITHEDYLAAKLGAAGFWVMLGALLPGLIATIVVLALGYVSLGVALTAFGGFLVVGILAVVALTGLGVFLSAISSKSAYAGAGIFGVLIGAEAIARVLAGVSGRASFAYLSPLEDVDGVARAVFGVPNNPIDPWAAGGILFGLGVATTILAYLRLRRTEVVAE